MTISGIRGLKIGGLRLTVDPLLPVVIILIGWLLSERYFPPYTIGYLPEVNYFLGGAASVLLTFSILFHELGHAFAARISRLGIDRIHLLLFGGMAELKHRPITAYQELGIAVSGPLASFLLAGLIWSAKGWINPESTLLIILFQFVVHINVLLAAFNLIPIFPLDGGRAARAFLWLLIGKFHDASVATLYLSYVLIALITLIGIADLTLYSTPYGLLILLLAAYLLYTVSGGKSELTHKPEFVDLLYRLDTPYNLEQTVRQIQQSDSRYLPRTVLPVLSDNYLQGVVHGQHIQKLDENIKGDDIDVKIPGLQMDTTYGTYIDLSNPESYSNDVVYHSDYVPVVQNGYFLGLCDAYELRFWLNQKDLYDPTKPYDPTDVIPDAYCE